MIIKQEKYIEIISQEIKAKYPQARLNQRIIALSWEYFMEELYKQIIDHRFKKPDTHRIAQATLKTHFLLAQSIPLSIWTPATKQTDHTRLKHELSRWYK